MKPKGSKNKRTEKLCKICNQPFMASSTRNVMCSQQCRNDHFNGSYSGVCLDCKGKTYSTTHKRCYRCSVNKKHRDADDQKKARFFAKVKKTEGCWIWTASRTEFGYGYFGFKDVIYLAHRVSCEMAYGKIPEGMQALHKCDNPPCVRPDHLYIGTPLDNALDRANKDRWNVNAKS